MKLLYRINPKGELLGLWHDALSNLEGTKDIKRVSVIEYDATTKAWKVEFLAPFLHLNNESCFHFSKRHSALAFERACINREIL